MVLIVRLPPGSVGSRLPTMGHYPPPTAPHRIQRTWTYGRGSRLPPAVQSTVGPRPSAAGRGGRGAVQLAVVLLVGDDAVGEGRGPTGGGHRLVLPGGGELVRHPPEVPRRGRGSPGAPGVAAG